MFFNHTPPPVIGPGVAQGAEYAIQLYCLVGAGREAQFDRIKFDGVRVGEVRRSGRSDRRAGFA